MRQFRDRLQEIIAQGQQHRASAPLPPGSEATVSPPDKISG